MGAKRRLAIMQVITFDLGTCSRNKEAQHLPRIGVQYTYQFNSNLTKIHIHRIPF